MDRLLFVSCGMSLVDRLDIPGVKDALGIPEEERMRTGYIQKHGLGEQVAAWILDDDDRLAQVFDADDWNDHARQRKRMSAELAILYHLETVEPARRGDCIVLVGGDEDGWVLELLRALLERVVPWNERPEVEVLTIDGLTAEDAGRCTRALETLRNEMEKLLDARDPVLCLSGGYKGTTAAMLLYGYGMHLNDREVRAYYLHETSKALIALPTHPTGRFEVAERRSEE